MVPIMFVDDGCVISTRFLYHYDLLKSPENSHRLSLLVIESNENSHTKQHHNVNA